MIKGIPRAIYWRLYSVMLVMLSAIGFVVLARQHGVGIAILTSILPGLVTALTVLFAFGYSFKNAGTQRRLSILAMVLCLKRMVPAILGATLFFQTSVTKYHWTAAQANNSRLMMVSAALLAGFEFWALAICSKIVHSANEQDGPVRRRRIGVR